MPFAQWLRPPRHVLAIFLCIMLVCGGALGWLGWQVLKQDRSLERQRVQERLDLAADHVAASLERNFSDLDNYLNFLPGPAAKEPLEGVVVLLATELAVNVYPSGRVLFYPAAAVSDEPPAATFAEGEKLEFQRNNPAKAAEFFRPLARSPDPRVRAGALLRLGRNLRKLGRNEEALEAYGELAQLGPVRVTGLPAELMAREARSSVLEALGKRDALRQEASLMYSALATGRWTLLRAVWEFHVEEARRWSAAGPLTEREQNALALSSAAEWIYDQWRNGQDSRGRRILRMEGRPVLISWMADAGRLAAVLAGHACLGPVWNTALEGQRVRGAMVDADGHVMIGSVEKNGRQAVRTPAATGLPATLQLTSADSSGDLAGLAARRRLLLAGFAVLALVLLTGSYFILRSITREHAVAKLQSEFVSAVSHEFRTPLTSLRQLSDMLSKGRIPTEELRQESYDILSRESERLQRLVESVLNFGRLEARAFRYRLEDLDPAALVRDLVAEFREKAAAQGYRVELAEAGEYPLIRADREAFGLALWNLLDNAVKYSPDCRTVWVGMARDSGRLAIQVRDRGMGIPAAEQKEIFKRFVRGAGSRASNIKGTGIGLAMARHIIEAHDGEIRVQSEPGQGSTFTILLPLEKVA
jgi:signal transduction histidine kinase